MWTKRAGTITIENPPPELRHELMQTLSLKNPSYHLLRKRGVHVSAFVPYYEYNKRTDTLTVPRGVYTNASISIDDDARIKVPAHFKSTVTLRDYQQGVPELLAEHEDGVAHLSTGYGKTIIALKLAELLQQRTLIIVPKVSLLKQFVYEIEKNTDATVGIIQGKKCSIETLTVATLQSARNRLRDGALNGNEFGTVIVDECHLVVPKKSRAVIQAFNAYYLFGFTGTLGRSDGQAEAINFLFGSTRVSRALPQQTPEVAVAYFSGYIPVDEYAEMITEQVENDERNRFIARLVDEQVKEGRRVLVLTKRINHYENLSKYLVHLRHFMLRSNDKESEALLLRLRKRHGGYDVLLGTFSLLSTGVDIPSLDTLVLAGDLKSSVLVRQSAGRILRLFDDKCTPRIIDVTDTGNGILHRQARERHRYYKSLGWEPRPYRKENTLFVPL